MSADNFLALVKKGDEYRVYDVPDSGRPAARHELAQYAIKYGYLVGKFSTKGEALDSANRYYDEVFVEYGLEVLA